VQAVVAMAFLVHCGTLTYSAATNLPGFSVAVGYYGGQSEHDQES